MKRTIYIVVFSILVSATLNGQSVAPAKPTRQTASLQGTISVKELSGNNLGNFNCSNITVSIGELGTRSNWTASVKAKGEIRTAPCTYRIDGIPTGGQISGGLTPEFPKGCDQKTFNSVRIFPMAIGSAKTFTYSWQVAKASCILLK